MRVIFEDIYSDAQKGEKEFIESCLEEIETYKSLTFTWKPEDDDEEECIGARHIWKSSKVNIQKIFRRIILSDIEESTCLDGSVYILDLDRSFMCFLYDDRGIDIYSDDITFLKQLFVTNRKYVLQGELQNIKEQLQISED